MSWDAVSLILTEAFEAVMAEVKGSSLSDIGLLLVTVLLFWATWRLARTTDDTSKRQLRAYVTLSGASMQKHQSNSPYVSISVVFKNNGITPAYEFHTWIEAAIGSVETTPFADQPPSELNRPRSILGPGSEATLTKDLQISDHQWDEVLHARSKIYVWGRVDYLDAFGKQRHFVFKSANLRILSNGGASVGPHGAGYKAN